MRCTHLPLAAVAAAAAVSAAAAQPVPWITQSALPTSSHLRDVHFVTPDRGFIVGANTTFLRTDDGGQTWARLSGTTTGGEPYSGIMFNENGLLGFISGNQCLRTVDGGLTWSPMPNLPVGGWGPFDFGASASSVFAGTNGAMAFSPDAGVTWEIRSGYPDCPLVTSMDFLDDTLGLVGGRRLQPHDEGIYRTTDGGVTWTRVYEQVARRVRWLSPTVAEATVDDGVIVRSEDAGLTWLGVGVGPLYPAGTTDAVDLGEGVHVCVTALGEIHKSLDGGFYFDRRYGPLAEAGDEPWAITRTPSGVLWVVGRYGFILRSDDQGQTWTQVSRGMGLLANDMEMLTNTFGMAVGGPGFVWKTTDGGRTWVVTKPFEEELFIGNTYGLNALDIVDEQFAITGGVHGLLLRTWDGGAFWENIGFPVGQPESAAFTDLSFVDRDNGWATINGVLHRTASAGSLWEPVPGVTGSAVHFIDAMRGWVLDGSGVVRRTADGGLTWAAAVLPGEPLVLESMHWLNPTTGWVAGRFGYLAKTTNGGASWQLQNIGGQGVWMFDIAARSATEVWGVGYEDFNNVILRSLNGGASWQRWVYSTGAYGDSLDLIRVRPDGGLHIGGFFGHMATDRLARLCDADWDADGSVNSGDISAFLTAWLASVQGGTMDGDVSGDGAVNSGDISAFLTAWLAAVMAGGC